MEIGNKSRRLVVPRAYFDPQATLECGQVFRYERLGPGDYLVAAGDKRCRVTAAGDETVVTGDEAYFYRYFDLATDYGAVTAALSAYPELTEAVRYGRGIRILRQDLFETIISFIISANNNIPRIRATIERICAACGTDMGGYYAFPTPGQLSRLSREDFRGLGCGFRDAYLVDTVRAAASTDLLSRLSAAAGDEARQILTGLKGVGQKVADCVALFGLHLTDSYPVDTWIFKANRSETLDTPRAVREYYTRRYGDLAGYAQQYLFYARREGLAV